MRFRSRGSHDSGGSRLRIFFCSDVHGSNVCFRKFLNAGRFYEADVLILGGDITGKQLVPLTRDPDGAVRGELAGERLEALTPDDVRALEERLADSGHYSIVCEEDEVARLRADPDARSALFERELLSRLERWMALADERLKGSRVRCLIQGGNDDYEACNEIIDAAEHVELSEDRVLELGDGLELISSGRANITPWKCPRDVPEEKLEALITAMADRLKRPDQAIFNLHCPPVDTPLDEAPALGSDLKPRIGPGGMEMAHVGSTAVRSMIERYRPLLSLHGHIHECKGTVRIGPTTCVNPGSDYGEGSLQGALIELTGSRLRSVSLLTG
jgi:Icc-related predicted phosphoesterase